MARVARGAPLLVGKRADEVEMLRWNAFAINELAPHWRAVRRRHSIVICPADAQIHFGRKHLEALGTPPLPHVLRIGEAPPHKVAWCIEHAREDKRGGFRGGRHRHSYLFDFLPRSRMISARSGVSSLPLGSSYLWSLGSTMTIQFTPNLSCVIPKRGEKNVLSSGMMTVPPSDNPLKRRSASAASLASTESAKPSNLGLPVLRPSDAITLVSPILRDACITLFSLPGEHIDFSGLSFQRISMPTSAPSVFL